MAKLARGNAPALPSGQPLAGKTVAILSDPPTIPWGALFNPQIEKYLHALGAKTTLQVYSSQSNPTQQAQQFSSALTQHPSAIVIQALDQKGLVPQLTRAKAEHIPVIVTGPPLDSSVSSGKLAATAETAAHYTIGVLSAKLMVQGLKAEGVNHGNILIISGSTADGSSAPRVAGFKAELAKTPQYKVVALAYSNWDPTTAAQVTGPLLAKYSSRGVNGIFGISGYVAVGAMQAAKQAGKKIGVAQKGIVFVGGNCNRNSWRALENGTEYGDFVQWPPYDAKATAAALVAAIQGKSLPQAITPPLFELTKKNAGKYKALCNY